MKKLKFFYNSIKNNVREMPKVVGLLLLNILFAFVFAAFFMRIWRGSLADTGGEFRPEYAAYLALCAVTIGVCALLMLHTYSYYLVKSRKRFALYISVGAGRGDIAGAMVAESLLLFLLGVALGAAVDSAIYAAFFTGDPFRQSLLYYCYLNWPLFFEAAAWALALPAVVLAVVVTRRLSVTRVSVA